METMLSDLKELDRLYREIDGEVLGIPASSKGNDTAALSDPVIRNRQLISRMEQMNARFAECAGQWLRRRDRVPREEREQVRMLAEEVRHRASRLHACCGDRTAQLEAGLVRLQQELGQVRNGARFLQSSRPVRANYPKFIDSHG